MDKIFKNSDEAVDFIVNLNKVFFLDNKEHIKKYYKIREIHAEVLDSMMNYVNSGKLPVEKYFSTIASNIQKETKNMNISLNNSEHDDAVIFNELFFYKTHHEIPSLTEIYIKNKKFKNKEKIKMLYAMNNSIVGLFKVINYDHVNGYVTYQDVFTNKKYKVIDIAMSSIGKVNENTNIYIYNRLITYDNVIFGTGLPCTFIENNKSLKEFIKKHKYNNCSDFSRCLILYDIAKEKNGIKMTTYCNY